MEVEVVHYDFGWLLFAVRFGVWLVKAIDLRTYINKTYVPT